MILRVDPDSKIAIRISEERKSFGLKMFGLDAESGQKLDHNIQRLTDDNTGIA